MTPLRPSLRWKILNRDGFRCRYCGRTAQAVQLHVDHVHPRHHGGKNDLANLVTACADCNAGKRTEPVVSPIDLLDVWSEMSREQFDKLVTTLTSKKRVKL